jgi:hypothetical protein
LPAAITGSHGAELGGTDALDSERRPWPRALSPYPLAAFTGCLPLARPPELLFALAAQPHARPGVRRGVEKIHARPFHGSAELLDRRHFRIGLPSFELADRDRGNLGGFAQPFP